LIVLFVNAIHIVEGAVSVVDFPTMLLITRFSR
jgi:hypothetical protein